MSDTSGGSDAQEEDGGTEAAPARKLSGKVLVLYIVAPLLVLIAGGGAAFFLLSGGEDSGEMAEAVVKKEAVFLELPEMLVNLSQKEKRAQYLKIKVALEMSDKNVSNSLQPVMPRIVDTFQVYLRELRKEDLEGSAGVYRLKEELLRRVNLTIRPRKIDRVLFKEIIIQ